MFMALNTFLQVDSKNVETAKSSLVMMPLAMLHLDYIVTLLMESVLWG